ncbi:MAG: response regulator transcription factor [Burkholderiales bacterium]|nr:response regulator transcription factor [Burkholderiales bacterium]
MTPQLAVMTCGLRVLIADDHAIVCEGLKQIISSDPAFMVIAEVNTAAQAMQVVRAGGIDILLLDISLPDRNGIDLLKQLKQETPSLKVLICSLHHEDAYALRALRAGAAGYLSKQCASSTLLNALHQVATGRKYISAELAQELAAQVGSDIDAEPHQRLSDREYQTLLKLATGMTVTEIAEQLTLSVKTISMYRTRLLQKMRMHNNAELTHYAIRHQLLPELTE